MKYALYHHDELPTRLLKVLKENQDGTLDIGDEDGTLRVGKCKVADLATHGQCTNGDEAKAEADKAAKAAKPAEKPEAK